ncbi:MAG TPA: HyaD/HybD family hydrogenase maturation endopeptidase [Gemmatimonadales bacterium]
MSTNPIKRTVVIGLGNPLMADDGMGLAVLARLREDWDLPPDVELVDGGTWGMNLLPTIEDAGRLILLDAVDTNAVPGTCTLIERARIPKYLAPKISPHQVDLHDVLALAELRGTLPDQTVALGLQPARVELGDTLSPTIIRRLDALAAAAVGLLETWGHHCVRRESVHA